MPSRCMNSVKRAMPVAWPTVETPMLAGWNGGGVVVGQDLDGGKYCIKIVHRFAHAHEDDIGDLGRPVRVWRGATARQSRPS